MTSPLNKILIVEDNLGDVDLVEERMRDARSFPFEIVHESRLAGAMRRIAAESFDVILLDLGLPDSSGLKTFLSLRGVCGNVPIVVLTGMSDAELGIAAIRNGAQDYLVKGQIDSDLLVRTIRYAIERNAADVALRSLAQIVDSTDEAVIGKTLDLIVTSWNKGAERLFGYHADAMIGQSILIIVPDAYRYELMEKMAHLKANHRVGTFDTIRVRSDGYEIDVSLTLSLIYDRNGKVIGASSIAQDISERKRIAAELAQAKSDAEAANLAKSDFLANMSHEIRTPMNGIIGLTGLVMDTALTHEQREYLEGVMQSSEALLKIINSILDFSKIEAGKVELESIEFDLRATVGRAVKSLARLAHEKQLELLYEVHPDVPDFVVGDPVRLGQVLINLVGNAVKFTKRGEVVIRVELKGVLDGAVRLHFIVSDTGIGIPSNKQGHLFQPFSQADTSMTRKYGGTGLGLAISKRLVELADGQMWLESTEGHGSSFHFTATYHSRPARGVPKPQPFLAELAGLRVLVVDDNVSNRRIQSKLLAQWGMKAVEAASGGLLEALDAAVESQQPFDLVLVDAVLPRMDDVMFSQNSQSNAEFAPRRILMVSSADPQADLELARELGAAACLLKPIGSADLLNAILTTLGIENSRTIDQHAVSQTSFTASPCCSLRILVVEDNAVNQFLAKRTLEKAGHAVVVANDGQEGLAAVDLETFDLILMDLQMPVMDGFQATARIRQQESGTGKHQQIVAMTAHALKGDRERCLAGGMDGYVSKPIRNSELFAAISAAAARLELSPVTQ
jgi:two-component system sensor histidine kinase/response regulator